MGLLGLYMGKVALVRKKLVGSAVFLKLVRPLVFSDPACAENRVQNGRHSVTCLVFIWTSQTPSLHSLPVLSYFS